MDFSFEVLKAVYKVVQVVIKFVWGVLGKVNARLLVFFILLAKCTPIFLYDGAIWNFREGFLVPSLFWVVGIQPTYV
jgi:hypothetical protein